MLFLTGQLLIELINTGASIMKEVVRKDQWRYKVEHRDGRQLLTGHEHYCPAWWSPLKVVSFLLEMMSEAPPAMRRELEWDFAADEIQDWGDYSHRYGEYRNLERVYLVSESFEITTPESVEHGDVADRGYEFEDEFLTREELLRHLGRYAGGETSQSDLSWLEGLHDELSNVPWVRTADPDRDFKNGSEKYTSLHIKGITGDEYYQLLKEASIIT